MDIEGEGPSLVKWASKGVKRGREGQKCLKNPHMVYGWPRRRDEEEQKVVNFVVYKLLSLDSMGHVFFCFFAMTAYSDLSSNLRNFMK